MRTGYDAERNCRNFVLARFEWALAMFRKAFMVPFWVNFSAMKRKKRIENYPVNGMGAAFIFKLIFIPCVAASSLHLLSNLLDEKTLTAYFLLGAFMFSHAQDFTNKGKEFWIGYGNHQQMFAGNTQGMDLYITSDVNTNVIVEIPGLGITNAYAIAANQITQINIPKQAVLNGEGIFSKGIHVMADKPVVVYAHIYFASVSGATLCLPVATLGRDYYSVNFTQVAQAALNANSYSYFFVVATEDNTTVEIVPSANTLMLTAGTVSTITLQKGQIYQALSNTDLTGSTIKSINTGQGCKKIAVFCGSGRIGIGCVNNQVSSSDNLYQQMYPTSTWGKKYYTVPSATRPRNYYRIIRPDPTSVVKLDGGLLISGSFTNGLYREFSDDKPHMIESDKPILVAQYFTTQDCGETHHQWGSRDDLSKSGGAKLLVK
jgi:hypothetical protein